MDEATLERRLHLNMTLIGGFMVGYGVINRHDILGSAQTGNMVSLAMDAVGHADEEWFFRIIALIIYVASVSLTVILSHKISKMSQKRLSILIDGAVLLIIGFYPAEMNPFVALFPIFFCYSFSVVFI
ncbi:MAG: YoaK family protein [Blautia obeum]